MAEIKDYSTSAGSNNSASPNGMPENMSPSGVNNAWREHAARHRRHWSDSDGSVTVGGTSTAMTATLNKGTTTLADIGPMILEFIASGSAPTLAVNGGTAKNLCWPDGTNIASGDIAVGTRHIVLYDADKDKFVVMTPSAKATPATLTTRGDLLTMNSTPALTRLAIGASSTFLGSDGSDPAWKTTAQVWSALSGAFQVLPRGHLSGLTLSNNGTDATNDIDIATGKARDGADAIDIVLGSGLTKQLDAAWAVGTNQGGLDTGAIANTTYFVWLIRRSDTGVVDALFSTSATAPTMPTNYDQKRRIGAILREGGAIVAFTQNGDEFLRKVPVNDVSSANPGTSAVSNTLKVPVGIQVDAVVTASFTHTGGSTIAPYCLVTSLDQTDTAPTSSLHDFGASATNLQLNGSTSKRVRTNTSAQIRTRYSASDANLTAIVTTHGWIDRRGRDA